LLTKFNLSTNVEGYSMKPKRELSAKELVADIRSGLTDQELMNKHKLSSRGLQSVYRKLVSARFMEEAELSERMPSFIDTADLVQARSVPRHYPFVRVPVYDLDNLTIDSYHIRDLSEKGMQVSGMDIGVGTRKTFLVQIDEYVDILPLHFEAECRWVQPANEESTALAGFEIVYISEDGRTELHKLIQLMTFQA
jgi:hypothetical protein